jgi:hypothetical protein
MEDLAVTNEEKLTSEERERLRREKFAELTGANLVRGHPVIFGEWYIIGDYHYYANEADPFGYVWRKEIL